MGSTGGEIDPARLGELPGESDEAVDAWDGYCWYMAEPCASSTGSDAAVEEAEEAWCSSCPTGVGDAGAGGTNAVWGEKTSVRSSWMGGKAAVNAGAGAVVVGGGAAADVSGLAVVVVVVVVAAAAEGAGGGGGGGSVGGCCLAGG